MRSIAVIGITLALAVLLGGCASSGKASRESITNAKVEANAIDLFRFVPHDKSVNWQIEAPVVTAIYNNPQDMKLIAPNRLLLIMDAGWARCPFMIDTDNGVLLWVKSLVECSDSIVNNRYCQVETAGIAVHQDMLLVRIQGDGGTRIVALAMATGEKRWSIDLPRRGEIKLFTSTADELLAAVQQDRQQAIITVLNLSSGALLWRKEIHYGSGAAEPPFPVIIGNDIWQHYDGVARVFSLDGKTVWHRKDILAGTQNPPLQLENDRLYLLDGKNKLYVLDAGTGKTIASAVQRNNVVYTNIYPIGDRIYLRGVEKDNAGSARFFVAAVRDSDGKEVWIDYDIDPSVSNLIDEDGKLYFSTPYTLIALDREAGTRLFNAKASEIGKSFPVQIKKYGDRLVYIGELVIAAYNTRTGAEVYRHGFDPVNQTLHMDALNDAIESTRKYLSYFSGPFSGMDLKDANFSNFFFQQARESQNQSNALAAEASRHARIANRTGSSLEASRYEIKLMQSGISGAFSNAQFSMGMAFMTVENIQRSLAEASAPDRIRLEKLLRMRKLLYRALVGTRQGDYVYRPINEAGTVGISVIHLPSGMMKHTPLTPEKDEVGIYSLVDFEKEVVYHSRIQKSKKEIVEDSIIEKGKKIRYSINDDKGFFVSSPIAIPKPK
jgi:outer membrane protein assembly factor BamB